MLYHAHTFLNGIKRFVEGQEEVEGNQHLGHYLTSRTEENIEKIREIVWRD
jgi:hypothetical protein